MIRELRTQDINRVMEIWLDTNIKAHDFIAEKYWRDNRKAVKTMLPQAEVYLCEDEETDEIQGFIGIYDNYIAGIFVLSEFQSKGIGKLLLNYVKSIKTQLTLSVYQKNEGAVKFYLRENFNIKDQSIDENTEEPEYFMVWER